jgi:2-oxoglutarate dehydrogenase E2 component (dihydrolipoamide succinyltransferase)
MSVQILVPALGESVIEATVAKWYKQPGDAVQQDEPLLELETDKVALEVNSPVTGALAAIEVPEGGDVEVGALLGLIEEGATGVKGSKSTAAAEPSDAATPSLSPPPSEPVVPVTTDVPMAPAAERLIMEKGLDPASIAATGRGGRLTKADVLRHLEQPAAPAPAAAAPVPTAPAPAAKAPVELGDREERVPMSRLRQTMARRLKEAQNTAAMLTTFNEVDMTALIAMRREYRDLFEQKHGVRLGYMSFFTRACVTVLQELPNVNAEIDGTDIIYKNHYDVGVAVSSPHGLVVPVVRDADTRDIAGLESEIGRLAGLARDGDLALSDLQGGTFTISNGGVFGSLMSTPILNPPQSGILGMHKIQDRPVAVDGEVIIRPMMYLALSYDHRIVDGREAVTFLVRVKECLEDPHRMLLDL